MKRKILLSIILLLLIFSVISFFTYSEKKDFNLNIDLDKETDNVSYKLTSLDNKYDLKDKDNYKLKNKDKEEVIKLVKAMLKDFNKASTVSYKEYVALIESHEVRFPSVKIGDVFFEQDDYKKWQENNTVFLSYSMMFHNREMKYKSIKDIVITYASNKRIIVKAYLDDVSLSYSDKAYYIDSIVEFECVYEKESKMYKINSMKWEWVNDINKYYNQVDKEERDINNKNANVLNNKSSYIPTSDPSINYDKLKKLSSSVTNKIYEDNKDKVAVIASVNNSGIASGNSTGFFIRSGVLVTTYDSFVDMVDNGSTRYYADINGQVEEIQGVVAAYPNLNLIILKLKKETKLPVQLGNYKDLEKDDPVVIISSSLGLTSMIKSGTYFDSYNDNIKVLRTSLPLSNGDNGSPIFNTSGQVIGINNNVSKNINEYSSGLNNAIDVNVLKPIIDKLQDQDFSDIKVIKLSNLSNESLKVINKVSKNKWNKYQKITQITEYLPVQLYSAYTSGKYMIIRYKNQDNIIDNNGAISLYKTKLKEEGYKEDSDILSKDNIKITVKDSLGYIVLIVEGV